MKVPLKPRLGRFSLRVPRKSQGAPAGKNLFILLVCSYEITGDPRVQWIARLLDDLGRKPHRVPFECRVDMANADFFKPTARADPIGEHAHQQSLPVGAAGDKSLEPVVLAHVVAIIMQMLPIFLQSGPAHCVNDRQRAVLTRRNRVANGDIVEINRLVYKNSE